MESSYQHGIFAPSYSESVNEAGAAMHPSVSAINETDFEHEYQLFTQGASQHEYQPLPHQLLNQNFAQPRAESSPMQFNHLYSNQEQDHRFFQQSQQLLFTPVHEQMQIEEKRAAFDLHRLFGLENQRHHLPESKLKTGQSQTCFLPQNDVIRGQQRPPQRPQRLLPDVPSADSACQTGNVHFDDWISQAYRELQTVREIHFSDLSKMYMKVCYSGLQPSTPEQAAKLGHNKISIEKMVQFLNIPITELVRFNQDKFFYSLYTVIKCVHAYKSSRGPVPVQVYEQSFSQLPFLQQWLDSKLRSQSAKPGSSGNTGSPQSQKSTKTVPLNRKELDRHVAVAGLDFKNVSSSIRIDSNTTVQPNSTILSPRLKQNNTNQMGQTQSSKQKVKDEEMKHQMLIQRVNEINEKQQFEYSHRSLFPSPWIHVSSRDKIPFFKGSPSKSVTSPLVTASLSSPAIPSPSPVCSEKISSPISSFTVKDNTEQPQISVVKGAEDSQPLAGESSGYSQRYVGVTLSLIENQLLTLGTPEKLDSPSPVDLIVPAENQMTSDKELSAKCLNEMIGSMSQKALIASVQDIMSVFTLIDTLSGEMITGESLKTVCEDLASDTFHHSQRSSILCKTNTLHMRKWNISASGLCLSSSCNENGGDGSASQQTLNLDFSAKSSNKRKRSEGPFNDSVLEEIKQINQSLIETVVDVASGFKEDIVVRFSYSAIGLDFNLNQRNNSFTKPPILFVRLLLPEDYPKSPPRVLDTSCCEAGESEDITERAKLMFSLSLRKLSEPFLLKDMARTWDYCARIVFLEFAQTFGGGSFSSMYGSWEKCTAVV